MLKAGCSSSFSTFFRFPGTLAPAYMRMYNLTAAKSSDGLNCLLKNSHIPVVKCYCLTHEDSQREITWSAIHFSMTRESSFHCL